MKQSIFAILRTHLYSELLPNKKKVFACITKTIRRIVTDHQPRIFCRPFCFVKTCIREHTVSLSVVYGCETLVCRIVGRTWAEGVRKYVHCSG